MPARDGTGPMGMGPMTGKGRGFCAVYESESVVPFGGRGPRCGWRRGMAGLRWRNGWGPYAFSQQDEITNLKVQARRLESTLESIRSRLNELGGDKR